MSNILANGFFYGKKVLIWTFLKFHEGTIMNIKDAVNTAKQFIKDYFFVKEVSDTIFFIESQQIASIGIKLLEQLKRQLLAKDKKMQDKEMQDEINKITIGAVVGALAYHQQLSGHSANSQNPEEGKHCDVSTVLTSENYTPKFYPVIWDVIMLVIEKPIGFNFPNLICMGPDLLKNNEEMIEIIRTIGEKVSKGSLPMPTSADLLLQEQRLPLIETSTSSSSSNVRQEEEKNNYTVSSNPYLSWRANQNQSKPKNVDDEDRGYVCVFDLEI